jgi:hypothetical protein
MTTGPMAAGRRPERLVAGWLGGVALLLVLVGAVVPNQPWMPELSEPDSQVRLMFDVTSEMNVWAWFNVLVLAAAAGGHALVGELNRRAGAAGWPWFAVAAFLAALSLDDLAAIHERLDPLGRSLGAGDGLLTAAWVLPGLLVAAALVWAACLLATRLAGTSRLLLVVGFGVFLGAAFGLEALGFAVLDVVGGDGGPLYASLAYLEELLEAWGAVLVLASGVASLTMRSDDGGVRLSLRSSCPVSAPPRAVESPGVHGQASSGSSRNAA